MLIIESGSSPEYCDIKNIIMTNSINGIITLNKIAKLNIDRIKLNIIY